MELIRDTIGKVKETIIRYRMTDPGDLLVVAVSGGPDSVCLLDILKQLSEELEISLVVAHFNHGLRQAEDESETRLVRELTESMDLPFETEKTSLLEEGSASMEERARDARYKFLEEVGDRSHASKIAMGHNLNDQAETVLMRLLRGSGPSGLAGIPPIRDNRIIRPLIEIKREDIESYIKARGLPYAIDSSNLDTKYLRNRIRLELMPMMLEYQPQLVEHLGQLATILRGEDSYLEGQAEDWVEKEAEQGFDSDITVPVISFNKLPGPFRNRVTRHLLKKIGNSLRRIDHDHIQSVSGLAIGMNPQAKIDLPNGLVVKRAYDTLIFSSGEEPGPREFSYILEGPGRHQMEQGRSITIEEQEVGSDQGMGDSEWIAYLDADRLEYPLVIRNFRPGDKFIPMGMKGHKKIKDFFIDLKVPSDVRASIPILISQDTVVWVCGYRIDERFKVTPQTKLILKVTVS